MKFLGFLLFRNCLYDNYKIVRSCKLSNDSILFNINTISAPSEAR